MGRKTYEKGTIAGDDWRAFEDKYRFKPCGESDSAMRKIWEARERAEKRTLPRDHGQSKALWEQFKTANANWKEILLARRAEAIEEWNEDHGWVNGEPPAEESSSDDEDEDGVLTSLPQFREGWKDNAGLGKILEECPELVGEESLDPTPARAHASRLLKSTAPADEQIKKKAWAHSDARWAAHRAKVARTGDGRLRGGRTTVSVAARTKVRSSCSWTADAEAAVEAAVAEEATTPTNRKADEPTWERIASKVNEKIEGASYTGTQCCSKAWHLGLLEAEVPRAHMFHPKLPPHKVKLDGLPAHVPRGRDARDAFMALPMGTLFYLMGFAYNMYLPVATEANRQVIVDALVAAEMCACDPSDHGVELPYLKTPAFTRANHATRARCMNNEKSHNAYARAMGPASQQRGRYGGPLSGRNAAQYARLARKRVLSRFGRDFRPRLGEHPPVSYQTEVIEYYTTCEFSKHDDFDPDQDCAVCRGLFIDRGGRVFCEHRKSEEAGLLAIRENGACMRCNVGWIRVFDELGRYGLDLGQKLRAAWFLAKKWSL